MPATILSAASGMTPASGRRTLPAGWSISQGRKLELTPDGAELIARLADGALRDALSILDTCAGVTARSTQMCGAPYGRRDRPAQLICSVFRMRWKRRTVLRHWHSLPSCVSSRWTSSA